MNKFITAVKNLDLEEVKSITAKDPRWLEWTEPSGKNALHYLCAVSTSGNPAKAETSLKILKFLLAGGMDINSVHKIPDQNCGHFPATPLWYAYTRGRNAKLYKHLLKNRANPENCLWAIAGYDDIDAAKLWLVHGAKIDKNPSLNDLFLGSFAWRKYNFAEWLLKRGADANAPGPRGLTALMWAVKRKEEDTIAMLMKYGADPDTKSEDGMSARELAKEKGPKRLAKLFEAS